MLNDIREGSTWFFFKRLNVNVQGEINMAKCRFYQLLVAAVTVLTSCSAYGQQVIDTVTVGSSPYILAVNPVSNKIYVANYYNSTISVIDGLADIVSNVSVNVRAFALAINTTTNKVYVADFQGGITIIDGVTNLTSSIPLPIGGAVPDSLAVNEVTNKIYVASGGILSVIDGTTGASNTFNLGATPFNPVDRIAVNPVTNKIYMTDFQDGSVKEIDGLTNAASTLTTGAGFMAVAVNPVTNKVYVASYCSSCNTVTVLDRNNNAVETITVGQFPSHIAINPVTNKIYVTNAGDYSVSVIDGTTDSVTAVVPAVWGTSLSIDQSANRIYVGNGFGGVSILDGFNNASVTLGITGGNQAAVNPTTHRVYVTNPTANTVLVVASLPLRFVPIVPCRVADTRNPPGPFGGPSMSNGETRNFPIPTSSCEIPSDAAAYSLNFTVVPHGQLGYLTVWPTGLGGLSGNRPLASTLNSLDGRVKANAAIVPAGTGGDVSAFVTDASDLIIDINGYFVADPNQLAFYPVTPCRVFDTRWKPSPLGGPSIMANSSRNFPVQSSECGIPSTAVCYSMNFTVVPQTILRYLTLWPTGEAQPFVSTLNAETGAVTANAAIVCAGTGGDISAFVTNNTDLIGDINGYFAPPAGGGQSLYPSSPCRVLDTRGSAGPFYGTAKINVVDVISANCLVPANAQSFVFNATVVPQGTMHYLTLLPDGIPPRLVSTLNAYDGMVTSNMAIVPTLDGLIDAFATNKTDLILDVFSYFAP